LGPPQLYWEVFDRTGRRIFNAYDAQTTWDGTLNGNACPEGAYVYRLEAEGTLKQKPYRSSYVGTVILMR
ncbi:MAG: gliding motility-associated C-terminal domain-containing protein, partial [Bacteroidia bacterium]|nr:gliding motility-associated C-terminal domain-containing protein [Bacteroidia bacterium]